MDDQQLPYWLAFWRTPGIGVAQFQSACERFACLSELFERNAADLKQLGFNAEQSRLIQGFQLNAQSKVVEGVKADLDWMARAGEHHIITWASDRYPALLREIKGAPPVLFVRGDLDALSHPQIAVVGSRHSSRHGRQVAQSFARELSVQGFVITSGLALGIDAAAHQGALDADGKTIAVLAHGLDSVYPNRNKALGLRIPEQGALVSEFPIGVVPRPEFFPRRNRIISGLSLGVLVVEAALKSGSLITAHEAANQGREVFAIPGSLNDPLVKGCHALIRNGAKLVENTQQIVEELMPLLGYMQLNLFEQNAAVPSKLESGYPASSVESSLLEQLEYEPVSVDQLVGLTGLSVADVGSALVMLELDGVITQQAGGYCRL